MTRIALIRHGPTRWNAERRVQGRHDLPLSEDGRRTLAGYAVPEDLAAWRWVCSPLRRARETARLLHGTEPDLDDRLVEASWGAWEGLDRSEVERREAERTAAGEAPGLGFAPPGGESPRDLWARLRPFLIEVADGGRDTVAVTHNGVLRIVHAMATGWDMTDKPAVRLRDGCAHVYRLDADGTPSVVRINLPLAADPPPG